MSVDYSLLGFFTQASPVVKFVMLVLLLGSLFSWTFIFQRGVFLKSARRAANKFEDQFWSGTDMQQIYNALNDHNAKLQGLEGIFHAGFKEYLKLRQRFPEQPAAIIDGVQRAMRIAQTRELEHLESHLNFLATVGSTSPYVGLFGTVWGIMTSFQALGNVSQATIAMVAPGISEALIATAMGLFAAIPAVIAYNRYANQVEKMLNRYDSFQEELTNILYRQANEVGAHHVSD